MHLSGGLGVSPPARFPPSLPSGLGPGPGCGRGCVGSLRGDLWVRIPGPSEGAAPMGAACPAGSVGVRIRESRAALDGHVARSPETRLAGCQAGLGGPAWAVTGCVQRLPCHPTRPLWCPRNGGDSLVLGGRQAQERNRDTLGPRRIAQGKPRSSPWVWHRVTELPSAGSVCGGGRCAPSRPPRGLCWLLRPPQAAGSALGHVRPPHPSPGQEQPPRELI